MGKYIIELDEALYKRVKYHITTLSDIPCLCRLVADSEPYNPQGVWLYHDKLNKYYCKDCGLIEPLTKEEIEEGAKLPNFCEQCGADMRGTNNG